LKKRCLFAFSLILILFSIPPASGLSLTQEDKIIVSIVHVKESEKTQTKYLNDLKLKLESLIGNILSIDRDLTAKEKLLNDEKDNLRKVYELSIRNPDISVVPAQTKYATTNKEYEVLVKKRDVISIDISKLNGDINSAEKKLSIIQAESQRYYLELGTIRLANLKKDIEKVQVVEATGEYGCENITTRECQSLALEDAKRKAIEQASVTLINSTTIVRNYTVKLDEIRSYVEALILKTEEIERKWISDTSYRYKIRAHVKGQIDEKTAKKLMGNPLFLAVSDEDHNYALLADEQIKVNTPAIKGNTLTTKGSTPTIKGKAPLIPATEIKQKSEKKVDEAIATVIPATPPISPVPESVKEIQTSSTAIDLKEALPNANDSSPKSISTLKKETKTWVVSTKPSESYISSINQAMTLANPGDTILIKPGKYNESVQMNKEINIIGDGARQDIIIEALDKSCIVFESTNGSIKNLNLRNTRSSISSLSKDKATIPCISISKGSPIVESNEISSSMGAIIAITNGADPTITNNLIHDGDQNGILISNNGKGIIDHNDIYNNRLAAIAVSGGSEPLVYLNRIFSNSDCGILVHNLGKGTYSGNRIFQNNYSNIEVREESNPKFTGNFIYESELHGVLIYGNATGYFEKNEIYQNKLDQVVIKDQSAPSFSSNIIRDGNYNGILVSNNGQGTFEKNKIMKNKKAGVIVTTGGNPRFIENEIYEANNPGINVIESGYGSFEKNNIFGNNTEIEVSSNGQPHFTSNSISNGLQAGIVVHDKGMGIFEENTISGFKSYGIKVSTESVPTFTKNKIFKCAMYGIYINDSGFGKFQNNEVFQNGIAGFALETSANPIIINNNVYNQDKVGILALSAAKGTIEGNSIYSNTMCGIEMLTDADPIMNKNTIMKNKMCGILAYDSAKGKIIENDIYENSLSGIELKSKANPLVTQNKIRNGGQRGVLVHLGGLGNFEQNDIYENASIGFEIRAGGNPVTGRNNVHDNKENFVYQRETDKPFFNW